MTVRFGNNRLAFYIAVFLLSAAVLGLAANLANLFLPNIHHDFVIFAIIVPSLQILVFLLALQWAQPRTEAIILFIFGVLWCTLGAWATDVIGNTQCDSLAGQMQPTKNGSMSAQSYCNQMRVIQAFSWTLFCFFVIAFIILMSLVSRAQTFGRLGIWGEPIRELPWFGEAPGYYNTSANVPGMVNPGMAQPMQYPQGYSGYPQTGSVPMTSGGRSIMIQPGVNGVPPTVRQLA